MQSMAFVKQTSLTALGNGNGFKYRAVWIAMVAILSAVLALTVSQHRTVWADGPEFSITVSDENYETANVSFTISNLPSEVDENNWIAQINYRPTNGQVPDTQWRAGNLDIGSYHFEEDFVATINNDGTIITATNVTLTELVPNSEYIVTVSLLKNTGTTYISPKISEPTAFRTVNDGCYVHTDENGDPDPDNDPAIKREAGEFEEPWHTNKGERFTKVTDTELYLEVSVKSESSNGDKFAEVDSGRCLYYTYSPGGDTPIRSVYVYGSESSRKALIELTGLKPGMQYNFSMSFHPGSGGGRVSASNWTTGTLLSVSSLEIDNITQTSARATVGIGNETGDEQTVLLRYYETADKDDPNRAETEDEEKTVKGPVDFELKDLTSGTKYKVEASLRDDFLPFRTESEEFVTLPGKPIIDSVTPSDGELAVSWTAPAETPAPLTGYRVQWQDYDDYSGGTGTPTSDDVAADVTTFPIPNLTNGTKYIVHVIAKNESFDQFGGTSSDGEFGTPMALPNEPNNLQVAPGNEKLTLTWEEPTAEVGVTVTGYIVQWKSGIQTFDDAATDDRQETVTTLTQTVTYKILDLANDTLYDVRVRADNGVKPKAGEDYNWTDGNGTPVPDPSIGIISVKAKSQTDATLTVTIKRSDIDNEQTVHLRHRVKSPPGGWRNATPQDTGAGSIDFELTSLRGNTVYEVEAWLAADTNDIAEYELTTSPVIPDPPTITDIEYGDRQLTVTWTKPGDGGSQITGYKIEWTVRNQNSWTSKTVNDPNALDGSTDQVLTNGTKYTVQVLAVNSVGDSQPSNHMHETPSTIPKAPTITEITGGNERLVVEWDEPDNGGNAITEYTVQWKSGNETFADAETDSRQATVTTLTTLKHTIPNLENDILHTVQVRARNDNGYGDWSVEDTGTPVPNPSIGVISVKTKSQTDATLTVAIERSSVDNEQTVHLKHRVKTPTGTWVDETPQDTGDSSVDFDLSDLTGNTVYEVEAWLAADTNDIAEYELTPSAVPPGVPTNTGVTHGDGILNLAWDPPNDNGGAAIDHYVIEWDEYDNQDWVSNSALSDTTTLETYDIQNLTNGTRYAVRVRADNLAPLPQGKSYNWVIGGGTPSTIPDAPTIQNVAPADSELTVTWNKPANGGNQITKYILRWRDNDVIGWASPLGTRLVGKNVFTETIGSLDNGTTYAIQVRAKNDNGEGPWSLQDTGTPRPDPSIDSITVADGTITQTTAIAIVNIAHPTGELKKVHLRYRINSSLDAWTAPEPQFTSTTSVEFPRFTGLKSDMEYRVEASFDGTFDSGVQFKEFTTKRPTVLSVEIDENSIEQAGATAIVRIHEPNGESQTVHLRYRPATQTDWSTDESDAGYIPYPTALDAVSIPIADLKSDTEYEVEASLESDYSQSATTTFTTEGPSLTGLTISEVMQQSAKAIVDIEAPNGRSLPIYVRYRKVTDPVNGLWAYVDTSSTDATAEASLLNLTSGTVYEAQASLDRGFPDGEFLTSEPFTTKGPSLTGLNWAAEMTNATISVTIQAPNDNSLTINYRYRPTSQTDWSTTATDAGSDSTPSDANSESAEIDLEDLNSSTQYQIQVSLASNWDSPTLPVLETTFTTTSPDTSITKIEVGDWTQTTAKVTVTLNNPDTNGNTVHLRLRKVGETSWPSPEDPENSDPDEAEFPLDQLDENTNYEVEVSLDSGFANSTIVPFWTLRESEISSVNAVDPTKTTVKAIVDILYPDGTERIVHLRYQEKVEEGETQDWPSARREEVPSSTNKAEKTLTPLISGTTYLLQASFDDEFPDTGTEKTEFTTKYLPSVSGVIVDPDTIMKRTATAIVSIANPDGIERTVYLQFRKKDKTPEDRWSDPPLEEDKDTDTGSASIPMENLDPGTDYEVQASFDNTFPEDETKTKKTTFTTKFLPSVSNVRVVPNSITKTTATAEVSIANPDGTLQTVHLRYIVYSATPDWENDGTRVTTTSDTVTATKGLENLLAGTTYILQASLDTNFVEGVESTTFPTDPEPSAGSVSVSNEMETTATATVVIDDSDGSPQTVHLQYRRENAAPTDAWESEEPITITTGSVTFDLDNLNEGTTYDVEAWLAHDASHKVRTTFTTEQSAPEVIQAPTPTIRSVTVGNETQTTAVATISIAHADGSTQTVKLQYRTTSPMGQWSMPPLETTSSNGTASKTISGLTANTGYEVQSWLATDANNKVTDTFRTEQATPTPQPNPTPNPNPNPPPNNPPPQRSPVVPVTSSPPASVTGVTFGNITQTSADATIAMSNEGKTKNTLRLRYREDGATEWDAVPAKITSGTSEIMPLTSLTAGTTHEVQAWLDSSLPPTGTKIYEFDTLDEQASAPDAAISNLQCENIGQTSATAMVEIANAGTGMKEVFLKHSMGGTDEWTQVPFPTITYTDSTSINLTGLQVGTTYQMAVALSEDFSGMVIESCTTLPLDPVVSGISVDRRKQTSVWTNISISNANGEDQTVHLRYRTTTPQGEWSDIAETTTSTDRASKEIAGLTADTEYEVQASLDSTFPDELTKNTTFTTLRFPSISNLEVEDETKNSATAVITLADPDGSSQTIHLRYRTTTPQGAWSSTLPGSSTTSEASIGLTGLAPDTEYEAEVSLTSDFTVAVSDVFRTLPPDPVVSKVSVNSIRQTTATAEIDIANANGSTHTVSLRYRTTTPRGDWSGIKTTTSDTDSASIDLSELTPGTEYDAQASLENSFPSSRTKHDTFTTLRWPSIASFEMENGGRNGATVNATIADSHGAVQRVHVRHRATSYIAWRPTQQVDSVDDIASLRLRGLSSGTEYIAEASLNESFPSDETRSVTFTTVKRKDDDDASSSGSGTVQAARAENIPLLGFSPQMLRFVAIEGGDNPTPQTFSVWNRAQGIMNFTLSNHEKWLYQDPLSGVSTGPADVVAISASVDISGLPEGQYVDVINIQISPAGRSPGQVIVVLDVLPPDYIRQFVSRDEGGVVTMPDGTVRLVVPPGSPPKDVDIELMKVNLQAHGQPPGEQGRVVVAIESNTYEPDGDTPEGVAYTPAVELWVELPEEDAVACDESRARVYSVKSGAWSLIEHRCETDESDKVWAVAEVERLGAFALVIDDAPVVATPTPVAAAVAPTPTAIPASAPAVIVQRISLPAQPPTPTPNAVPTAVPAPVGKPTVATSMDPTPTPTAVPESGEPPASVIQASVAEGGSGSLGRIVIAALGMPLLIGALIVAYLLYREKRPRDNMGA